MTIQKNLNFVVQRFHRRIIFSFMNTATVPTHIRILRESLESRQQKNMRYSLRAFASYLEMHPSALSRTLAGKQELSVRTCKTIFQKLEMTARERQEFISSLIETKAALIKEELARFFPITENDESGNFAPTN